MIYPVSNIRRILFLDIETVVETQHFCDLTEEKRHLWLKKSRRHAVANDHPHEGAEVEDMYKDKAGIYAEFAKIICISVGYIAEIDDHHKTRVKSFAQEDESELLRGFASLLNQHYYDKYHHYLCGHNIKEFDIPFICRRMMIHSIALPNLLRISGYRPWQTPHILDTMEMWKYGDYKHYTSLELLCSVLKIPTPKSEMSGEDVYRAYWEGRLQDIEHYCEQDVIATARVYMRCAGIEVQGDELVLPLPNEEE